MQNNLHEKTIEILKKWPRFKCQKCGGKQTVCFGEMGYGNKLIAKCNKCQDTEGYDRMAYEMVYALFECCYQLENFSDIGNINLDVGDGYNLACNTLTKLEKGEV